MDDHAFDLHFDTSDEEGACDFPISETSWNSYGYLPDDNAEKLKLFAHFTPKIHVQRASTVVRPDGRRHASDMEEPQYNVLRTLPAMREIEESHERHPQSGPDGIHCNTRRVGQDTVYSYTDVDPSIKTVETVDSGRRVLIGYLRRPGSNKNLVYASIDSKLAYIHRRAVCFNIKAQHVDIGGGTSVAHRHTVYFREFVGVANDRSALLEEVRRRIGQGDGNGAGASNTVMPLRDASSSNQISVSPMESAEVTQDATRTFNRSTASSNSIAHSQSSGLIIVHFTFKEGTQGTFKNWQGFHLTFRNDFSADRITAHVDKQLKLKADRSTRLSLYKDDLRAETYLGVNEQSMMLLRPGSVLSDYVARYSDRCTRLLAHIHVYIYKDGGYLLALDDIHNTKTGPRRQKRAVPSDSGLDSDLEDYERIQRPRRARASRGYIENPSGNEPVMATFAFADPRDAAGVFWCPTKIFLPADATYQEAKERLRPRIIERLMRSELDYDPQSAEQVPFEFRVVNPVTSELVPFAPGQTVREFGRGRSGLKLFGEITVDLKHAPPTAQDEADVPMAGLAPRGQMNGNTAARAMQGNIRSPTEESDFEFMAQPRRASSSEA